jgi:hypothetical protein
VNINPSCTMPAVACPNGCSFSGSISVNAAAHIGPVGGALDAASATDPTHRAAVASCSSSGSSCTDTEPGHAPYFRGTYQGVCTFGFPSPSLIDVFATVTCTMTATS